MHILIDTNIIISGAMFPNPRMKRFLSLISNDNNLYLCSYALDEAKNVVARKFRERANDMAEFLYNLKYKIVPTPTIDSLDGIDIRDPKDYPILASAIRADVDILISGDKDFQPINITRPEILTISEFMKKYDRGVGSGVRKKN